MALLQIQPLRSEIEVNAKAEVKIEVRVRYWKSKSTSRQNVRFLAQKLAYLW